MTEHEVNPYFKLYRGEKVWLSEIQGRLGFRWSGIQSIITMKEVVGQYDLFDPDDLLLWIPRMVNKIHEEKTK